LILICHVDDILVTGPSSNNKDIIDIVINLLLQDIELQDLGEVNTYLGINIKLSPTEKTVEFSQKKYLSKITEKYNKQDLLPVSTPAENGVRLEKNQENATEDNIK
jgi:hypothetical protein